MALTPWNATLALALRHVPDLTINGASIPTSDEATYYWTAEHARLKGRLGAKGITVSSGGDDATYMAEIESMFTSARIGSDNDMQMEGANAEHFKRLRDIATEMFQEICDDPEILVTLGAAYDLDDTSSPTSLAVDHPNSGYSDSDVEEQLPVFRIDQDL